MKPLLLTIALIINIAAFSQNTDTIVKHRLDSIIRINHASGSNSMRKTVFSYDEYEKEIFKIYYSWNNRSNSWEEYFKEEYMHDINGNRTTLQYWWSRENNTWGGESSKHEYTYDSNTNLIKHVKYYNIQHGGKPIEKTEYTYNRKNKITRHIDYTLENDIWKKENIMKYRYRGNKIIMRENPFINILAEKHKLWHDADGNLIKQKLKLRWLCFIKTTEKIEYIYDSKRNIIQAIEKVNLETVYKYEFVYDTSYPVENIILPQFSDDFDWRYSNMLIEKRRYKKESNIWELYSTEKYYYSTASADL